MPALVRRCPSVSSNFYNCCRCCFTLITPCCRVIFPTAHPPVFTNTRPRLSNCATQKLLRAVLIISAISLKRIVTLMHCLLWVAWALLPKATPAIWMYGCATVWMQTTPPCTNWNANAHWSAPGLHSKFTWKCISFWWMPTNFHSSATRG